MPRRSSGSLSRRRRAASAILLAVLVEVSAAGALRAAFVDVSTPAGFTVGDVTYGLAWGDLDADGAPDLLVCRHYYRPIVYRNLGGGSFSFVFHPPLFDPSDHHGPLLADFDNDGDLDIYLTSGAEAGAGSVAKKLYRNDGDFAFVDVAPAWGLADSLARGRGVSAIDLEADGDVDLFVAKAPRVASPNSLFLNETVSGVPSFTDIASAAGVADDFGSVGGIWGDYDRDGDPDLFISGEEGTSYETRLYRNEGNLTFSNVTAGALAGIGQATAAAWGDYDNDGDLDLAVGLGDEGLFDAVGWGPDTLRFFFNSRNNDDGLDGLAFMQAGDSARFDPYLNGFYQSDFVFISEAGYHPGLIAPFVLPFEIFGAPQFSPGESVGYYIWTQPEIGGVWQMRCNTPPGAGNAFAGTITSVNGWLLDVSLVSLEARVPKPKGTRLYRNEGDGTFSDVSAACGLADTANVRMVSWVDADLDGWLDLHVLNKGDTEQWNGPNVFYRNQGDGTFLDETAVFGLEGPSEAMADACAFGDYDGDGDPDLAILSGAGPRYFTLWEHHRLYENVGPAGGHLKVELHGVHSTREGYGAWVRCVCASSGVQWRYVAGNAWRGSQAIREILFGLGAAPSADSLVVEWPTGFVSVLTDVAAGETVVITEPDPTAARRETPRGAERLQISARPNPTRGEVAILLRGREGLWPGRLEIHDLRGRRVRGWTVPRGLNRIDWDRRDAWGRRVAAGVYFARLREGCRSVRTKIVLLE